jgi:enoyl-CoA hydratase/carnithine racemase
MISCKIEDRAGEIVIDRPSAGNAVTSEMARQFAEAVRDAAEKCDVLVIKGAGDDFTVGRDRHEPKSGSPFDAFRTVSALNKAIVAFPGIVVTSVRGRAHGLGVGLVMRSDIAIAAETAQFGLDEVAHGIPPMFIMEEIVEHLPSKAAFDIVLSGRSFGPQEALQMGLLSRVVCDRELDTTVGELVQSLQSRDRKVVLACKRYMRAVRKLPIEARPAFALVEQTEFAMASRP